MSKVYAQNCKSEKALINECLRFKVSLLKKLLIKLLFVKNQKVRQT